MKADKDASDDEEEDDGRLRTAFIGNQGRGRSSGGVFGSVAAEAQVRPPSGVVPVRAGCMIICCCQWVQGMQGSWQGSCGSYAAEAEMCDAGRSKNLLFVPCWLAGCIRL